ncbi:general stress protein [Salinibacterium sp. PAMC 21357]|uniref:general stress protein n=1 Tax=Salinibacterium sp. PAMC 21357 TaxID=1112215 RepID=UPI00028837EA|nr:general stress protein [Salinibacterium sp. PAMC 21357]
MSNFTGFSRRARQQSSVPRGDVLGSYDSYTDAQSVINQLAKAEFDIKNIAIVGRDLTTVEVVTARLSYGRAALGGAITGAWLGLFFGLITTILAPVTPQQVGIFFAAVLTGAGIGMIFGVVNYSMMRKRRDYAATSQLIADRYEIIISPERTAKAHSILGTAAAGMRGVHDAPPVPSAPDASDALGSKDSDDAAK